MYTLSKWKKLATISCLSSIILLAAGNKLAKKKIEESEDWEEKSRGEKFGEVAKYYIPGTAAVIFTVYCTNKSKQIDVEQLMTLLMTDREYSHLYSYVVKESCDEEIDNKIKKAINNTIDDGFKEGYFVHDNVTKPVLFFEPVTNQFVKATIYDLMQAELYLNRRFVEEEEFFFSDFLRSIGIPKKKINTGTLGWYNDDSYCYDSSFIGKWITISYHADNVRGKNCFVIDYSHMPDERSDIL